MGQEFVIKSTTLEDKINQLLPSQGGAQAGVDLSASTTIIPIVDLTESAEGSLLRQDLQSALSHTSCTTFNISNAIDTVMVNTTGYFRVFGSYNGDTTAFGNIELYDGATEKRIASFNSQTVSSFQEAFDFIVFLSAGDTLQGTASSAASLVGVTRQLADINGNLTNPL